MADVPINTGDGIKRGVAQLTVMEFIEGKRDEDRGKHSDGIKRGVAQLTVMEFIEGKRDEDRGKHYFRAAGVVMTPQHHGS